MQASASIMQSGSSDIRLDAHDWDGIRTALDTRGFAILPSLLPAHSCQGVSAWFERDELFRSHVVMRRHGFGEGEYKYFADPLPPLVQSLRSELYAELAPIANQWQARFDASITYPATHSAFAARCRAVGQTRPTPLLLRYRAGDYNRLHQDLYGELCFPLQLAVLLDRPGVDFEGGEFVLTEQKPRSQSRVQVLPLSRGDAVVFAVNERPVMGQRGYYRLRMRHGVSELRSGLRHTLGVIFHDAS